MVQTFTPESFGDPLSFLKSPELLQQLALRQQGMQQAEQLFPAKLALTQAQASREKALADMPFGGQIPPGTVGQIFWLEQIGKRSGYDSPEYKSAKEQLALQNQALQTKLAYQKALTETIGKRYTSPLGKLLIEKENISQGRPISGGLDPTAQGIEDQHKNDLMDLYQNQLLKKAIPTQTLNKNLLATNLEKTLDMINPYDLVAYSGVGGSLQKAGQSLLAGFGSESEKYDKAQEAARLSQLLAHQARQFYGDSIQPTMLMQLNNLTNPSSWKTNPQLALKNFYKLRDVLKSEMGTYRSAVKGPQVYYGQESSPGSQVSRRTSNSVRMKGPDGKIWKVPADKKSTFEENGYSEVSGG